MASFKMSDSEYFPNIKGIRRLNIIAEERFERLRRVIAGIRVEREEISREIESLKE